MRRFLALWLTGLVALCALVAAFNAAVDPYGILGTPRIPGLTAEKSAAADRPRLTKSYLVDRADARTLILGASNVDVGFDPLSPAIPQADRPAFNLAIDGSLPSALADYLRHSMARNHPKLILVGLSLEDSMVMPASRLAAADQALYDYAQRLRFRPDGSPNPGYLSARLQDYLFATLSTQALTDSVLTLFRQDKGDRNLQTPQGHNTGDSFIRWTRDEGANALVTTKDRDKTNGFLRWAGDPRTELAPLADIVRLARSAGARLIFFIQPAYVDELEIMRQTGLMPAWAKWKQDLVQTITQAAGTDPVTIWDFSGFNQYSTQALPAPGDTSRALTWFWEPIHYRKALGTAMLQRMLGNDGPADLGTITTPQTLPAQLAQTLRQQAEWEQANPDQVRRIATMVDALRTAYCNRSGAACPPAKQEISSK